MPKRNRDADDPGVKLTVDAPLKSTIGAVSFEGFRITTSTGEPATLAIVDQNRTIIEASPAVSRAAWDVAIAAYRNFLIGKGHLRVLTQPPDPPGV